jgi:hypothetical protein
MVLKSANHTLDDERRSGIVTRLHEFERETTALKADAIPLMLSEIRPRLWKFSIITD